MIANIDIGISFFEILLTLNRIVDEGEDAEYQGPGFQKGISNPADPCAEQEGNGNHGEEQNHENRKDQEDPEYVE